MEDIIIEKSVDEPDTVNRNGVKVPYEEDRKERKNESD